MLVLCVEITSEQKIHNSLGITNNSIQIGVVEKMRNHRIETLK